MASIEFDFNGEKINIPFEKETTIEQILKIFEEKAGANKNNLIFLYSGNKMTNYQLTFDQIANKLDKERNKMNIVVTEMENKELNKKDNDYNNSNLFDFTQNLSETNYTFNVIDEPIYSSTEQDSTINMINNNPEYLINTESEAILYDNATVTEIPVNTPTNIYSPEPIISQNISEQLDSSNIIQDLNINTNSISTPIEYTTSIEEIPINISSETNTSTPLVTTEIQNEPIYTTTTTTVSQPAISTVRQISTSRPQTPVVQQIPVQQVPIQSYTTTIQESQESTNPVVIRPTIVIPERPESLEYITYLHVNKIN